MNPDSTESEGSSDNVAVEEDFIKGVANGGWRLEEEECECNSALRVMLAGSRLMLEKRRTMNPVMMNSLPVIDA
jgi:hypothetical protein